MAEFPHAEIPNAVATRIGLIGLGQIGSTIYREINAHPEWKIEIAFVHDADAARTSEIPPEQVLGRIEDFAQFDVDMVCELAHADISFQHGTKFLEKADYFMLSVTAIADAELERNLRQAAEQHGTRLWVPHGGVAIMDLLHECREIFDEVRLEMIKPPQNLDFSRSGIDPATITERTVLHDGPVREVCQRFPRNVNTLAAAAFAGKGLDETRAVLIADPDETQARVNMYAQGGGVEMKAMRAEDIEGVTGAATPVSVLNSIRHAAAAPPGLHLC